MLVKIKIGHEFFSLLIFCIPENFDLLLYEGTRTRMKPNTGRSGKKCNWHHQCCVCATEIGGVKECEYIPTYEEENVCEKEREREWEICWLMPLATCYAWKPKRMCYRTTLIHIHDF